MEEQSVDNGLYKVNQKHKKDKQRLTVCQGTKHGCSEHEDMVLYEEYYIMRKEQRKCILNTGKSMSTKLGKTMGYSGSDE